MKKPAQYLPAALRDLFRPLWHRIFPPPPPPPPEPVDPFAVHVREAFTLPLDARLLGANLDTRGDDLYGYHIAISGWAIGREMPITAISVTCQGIEVASGVPELERPDVAGQFPDNAAARTSGFLIYAPTLGLGTDFTLEVAAVFEDGERVPFGQVRADQQPPKVSAQPRLQPVMVTFFGRSGSTWLMRLLSEHPQIAVFREYPYEIGAFIYWMHMLRVLTLPADHLHSARADTLGENQYWVGRNPAYLPHLIPDADFAGWIGQTYAAGLIDFALNSIETFYRHVARVQSQPDAIYFAEKVLADTTANLAFSLYPGAREIVLVRDPRDVTASVISFNAKRGYVSFNYDRFTSEADYMRYLRDTTQSLLAHYEQRRDSVYLLRYEDLIQKPKETLAALLAYLNLDSTPEAVDAMLQRASVDTPELAQHRTTSDPASSIGRWQRDFTDDQKALADAIFGDVLVRLGYTKGRNEGRVKGRTED